MSWHGDTVLIAHQVHRAPDDDHTYRSKQKAERSLRHVDASSAYRFLIDQAYPEILTKQHSKRYVNLNHMCIVAPAVPNARSCAHAE
jgi:hypothetical protein